MSDYRALDLIEVCFKIATCSRALILSHVNPDGDTIGSAFALKGIIEAAGGEAVCRCQAEAANYLRFIYDGQETIVYEDGEEDSYDLILAIDVASPSQLGTLAHLIGKIDLMIDHHGTGEAFADNYIDHSASSAGEIVYRIYKELKERGAIDATPDVCRKIYMAMVCDTGCFKFANTTPDTHKVAAELLCEINGDTSGLSTSKLISALFGTRTRKEVLAQKIALQSLTYTDDGDVAAVMVTRDEMLENQLEENDIGNIVDIPRGIEGVMVGLSVKESLEEPGVFRISSRANCDTDLSAICAENFGGGGHKLAAGGTVRADSPAEAFEKVISAFAENYKRYLTGDK